MEGPGRYQLVQELGRGGQGVVYKALDAATGGAVAVKKVPRPAGGREAAAGLLTEVEALQGCEHPNVVKYLGHYWDATHLWIVLEYCAGGSLSALLGLADEPLGEAQVAYVCREVLAGLAYLHALGKVHRDLKCSNVLLTGDGRVKLADLGVLQDARGSTRGGGGGSAFLGTPHWVAPEVFQKDSSGNEVDIWALGISVIEMVQHVPPHWDLHPMKVIFEISNGPPPAPVRPEGLPPLVLEFISACLEKDPAHRPGAVQLLEHPLLRASGGGELFRDDIARFRGVLREMGPGPVAGGAEGGHSDRALPPTQESTEAGAGYIDTRGLGGHIRTVRGAASPPESGVRGPDPPPPSREESALAFEGPLPFLQAAAVSVDALLFPVLEPENLPEGARELAASGSSSAVNLVQELEFASRRLKDPGLSPAAAAALKRRRADCVQAVRALATLYPGLPPAG